ncbi:MAG: glycosyltransferase 87 family protein [Eubacterium sp.]|nr:glycosyltransferase 87 family protein [Eubacterium sp.]
MIKEQIKQDYKKIFIVLLLLMQICFIIGLLIEYDGYQAEVFFQKGANYLADFVNVAKYSADKNPYFNGINGDGEHAYLPFTYLLFYLFSRLSNYIQTDAFSAGYTYLSLAVINIFFMLLSICFFIVLRRIITAGNWMDDLLVLLLFGTGIYLFSYERGNIVILSAVCTAVYLNYFDSESRICKHLSFISLAIAAALKGYPALLGVLVLYNKKWKDAGCLLLYGMLLGILPFMFFENGLANIPRWMENVRENSIAYKFADFPRFGYLAFLASLPEKYQAWRDWMDVVLRVVTGLCCIWMLLVSFAQKIRWKKLLSLVLILLLLPVNSAIYCGLYMFPIVLLFFCDERQKMDMCYLLLLLIFLNPLQIRLFHAGITWYLVNIASMIMFGMLLFENSIAFASYLKNYRYAGGFR